MQNLENLMKRESGARDVLTTISESGVALPYAFRKPELDGFNSSKTTGLVFLVGDEGVSSWKYISYKRIRDVLDDTGAINTPYGDVAISRGGFTKTVSPFDWSQVSNAGTMVDIQARSLVGNEESMARLMQDEITTVDRNNDPKLYEEGEARVERAKLFWNVSNSATKARVVTPEEVLKGIKEAEERSFYRSQNLPPQISTGPYHRYRKRIGD